MRTTGRLALLGSFAAAGVGVALCLGMSANPPDPEPTSKPANLAAAIRTVDDAAEKGRPARTSQLVPRPHSVDILGATAGLSSSAGYTVGQANRGTRHFRSVEALDLRSAGAAHGRRVVGSPIVADGARAADADAGCAGVLYAQQAVPPSGGRAAPGVLELLRKGLRGLPAATPPAPAAPAAAETVLTPPPAQTASPRGKATVNGEGDGKLTIHIYGAEIRDVLDMLSQQGNLNILASKSVEGKVSATLKGVDIDSALRAILKSTGFVARHDGNFIFVGTPEDFTSIEHGLDRIGTRVYRTNYITAAELKGLIAPLLTEKTGVVSVSTPAEVGIPTTDSAAGGDKLAGGEALVVRDYEAVLCQIDQLVAEMDVRPLQVSIEAMILDVQLSDEDKFGVNFQLLRQNPNISFGLGSPPASLSAADFPLNGGLKFGFLDSNLGAFIEALEQVGDTNVIANPRLMVLNKQRAEIQIGEQKGYINQTVTETSSSQSVEFLDIGAAIAPAALHFQRRPDPHGGPPRTLRRQRQGREQFHLARQDHYPSHHQHHGPRRLHRDHRRPDQGGAFQHHDANTRAGQSAVGGFRVSAKRREDPSAMRCWC